MINMKYISILILISLFLIIPVLSCKRQSKPDVNILFLHHSTGNLIWRGTTELSLLTRAARKLNDRLGDIIGKQPELPVMFNDYKKSGGKNYLIEELSFPKAEPYGWKNYPYDYFNIWVKHSGSVKYMEEPTLEILTQQYQVVIFKHCFPVCSIEEPTDSADVNSEKKTIPNYKLQYMALRDKLHEFPETKFILFTGAARVKQSISEAEALRSAEFFSWVKDEWDLQDDNIYIWDLYALQTENTLYFKDEYAASPSNSHPNKEFAGKVVKLLFNRIIDVIENDGTGTNIMGEPR